MVSQFFQKLSLSLKLAFLVFISLVGLFAISVTMLISEYQMVKEEFMNVAKRNVETAHSAIDHYKKLVDDKKMSLEDAQAQAIKLIGNLRYGDNQYFWVNDLNCVVLMHPMKPEFNGKNMSELKDVNGTPIFSQFVQVVKSQGEGYAHYVWYKPDGSGNAPKTSFIKGYTPWGWVLGSGVHLEAMDHAYIERVKIFIISFLLVCIVVVAVSWFIVRNLKEEIGGEPSQVRQFIDQIASGDLSGIGYQVRSKNGGILASVEQMRLNLIALLSEVRRGIDHLAQTTHSITTGNEQLAERTESQAQAIHQTATSITELSQTVIANDVNANDASRLAFETSDIAKKGGAVVSDVVATMNQIHSSSNKIVDITAVIDGIAFQTNLLALNAAVEAARAGEQGRGFAVVATEVRSLAQRSANAAKEIKQLIDVSVGNVNLGNNLVKNAGETMEDVLRSVQKVEHMISTISEATQEQTHGINRVKDAIAEMDEMTRQNGAMVHEAASTAQNIHQISENLHAAISVFKLDSNTHRFEVRTGSNPRLGQS